MYFLKKPSSYLLLHFLGHLFNPRHNGGESKVEHERSAQTSRLQGINSKSWQHSSNVRKNIFVKLNLIWYCLKSVN